MTRQELFDIWAPANAIWSAWAKPVLFASAGGQLAQDVGDGAALVPPGTVVDLSWAPPPSDDRTAVVVDLPSSLGVYAGLALAERGYRPVPLYNATPASGGASPAVDVWLMIETLIAGGPFLARFNLRDHAPPAFLLDAERRYGTAANLSPGMYDNRSVSLPTDFPSANTLLSRGIGTVLLVQNDALEPQEDLAHTLLRWQQAGIRIQSVALNDPRASIHEIEVRKPMFFREAWQRLLATMGLRRNPLGGFGGLLPIPSSSAG